MKNSRQSPILISQEDFREAGYQLIDTIAAFMNNISEGPVTAGKSGSDFSYQVKVLSDASQEEIEELLKHTDGVAEIHNSIRKGLEVKLVL